MATTIEKIEKVCQIAELAGANVELKHSELRMLLDQLYAYREIVESMEDEEKSHEAVRKP